MATLSVYLEVGARRTFASAVDWPGWTRSGRGRDEALDTLASYRDRYARAAARAGAAVPIVAVGDLTVTETLAGDATTDFGAPGSVPHLDRHRLGGAAAGRLLSLLRAAWAELDAVAAATPGDLVKGPRGGGRELAAILDHVGEAERAYARRVGVRLTAREWRDAGVTLLRERIGQTLSAPSGDDGSAEEGRWPVRYMVRRTAWHALDHAWEIEDRRR